MRERSSGARGARPQIVIIGAGYAGYHCARGLERRLPAADIVIISPTDYMPYLSLLPEVGAGIVNSRHIAVSLPATLRQARLVPGHAIGADLVNRSVTVAGPDGGSQEVAWDRLVIAPGSVSRTLRLPGVLDHAKGFKNLAEALYLRDHLLAQMELADASDDPARRRELRTFVVVGAGYTGTEVAAQGQLFTRAALRRHPRIHPDELRWLLVEPGLRRPAGAGPPDGPPGPAHPPPPRARRAARDHDRGDHRPVGPALRRHDGAHPHRGLVCRRDAGAAHPGARAGDRQWADRGGRVPRRPGPPGHLCRRRCRGRARPHQPGTAHAHDRPARATAGQRRGAQPRRLAGPRDRPGIQAPRSRLRGGSGRLAGRREPLARSPDRRRREVRYARLSPLRPARQPAAGGHRLVQRHHRAPPVRPARPDPARPLRAGGRRADRHLLPDRRAAA